MSVPQFGRPEPGREYPDRPAAFVVVEHAGKLALVRVTLANGGERIDLPGGGLEHGESAGEAAARECGEEAGLRVEIQHRITCADHFFVNDSGRSHNTRGQFFSGRLVGEAPELKVEEDHALVWLEPLEALRSLSREAHAWAVASWLRGARD
ncbi:NUDIX domain-containing protein [Phenylobacterium deserti]|uniref:DNA mismatch repair protein MutT n=1 Tax=Phenylobacterium deserti TaxID=1914756 RepID=A0A328AJ29_9CAUL|nr:NUDIX domain-containing protein [Phenylobacterium deserti]RAK52858.1 DNA mismatch repair protein MutT [Phenylobacterium deserti]